MRFASPYYLLLIVFWGGLLWWQIKRKVYKTTIKYSDVTSLRGLEDFRTKILVRLALIFRFLAILLVIFALARPQAVDMQKEVLSDGIDIVLAIDVSGSMRAEDFKPSNRLAVAKSTVNDFVNTLELIDDKELKDY